jgi:FtsZ-interacting cell division protein ZipA
MLSQLLSFFFSGWRTLAFGLIAVSATLFIVIIIIIALFVWLHNRETRSIKTSKHSTQRKPSVSESGISSYHDHDEGETCKMIVDAKAGQQTPESNISRNSFTDSENCKSDQTTAALEERKRRSSTSNVDITNISKILTLFILL